MTTRARPSYDDVVRRTVLDPDGSVRPSTDQEREAREGFRAMDAAERALFDRVWRALIDRGLDLEHIGIEVDGTRVTVRGQVRNAGALADIPELIRDVDGVDEVIDELAVGAPPP